MFSQLSLLVENILAAVVNIPKALLTYVRDWLHYRELVNRFPGPPRRPIVGNLFDCGLFPDPWTLVKWVEDVMNRYPVAQILMGPVRMILLNNPSDIQILLMNSRNQKRPKLMGDGLAYCLGRGLVTINGEKWSIHHKIMNPPFHKNLLKTYIPVFDRKSDVFIEQLAEYANGCAFDVKFMTETLEVDIVFETLFGIPSIQQTEPDQYLFECVLAGQKEISNRIRSPWLYNDIMYKLSPSGRKATEILKYSRRYMKAIVEQRKELLCAETEILLPKETFKTHKDSLGTRNVAPTSEDLTANKKQLNILIDALMQENGKSISHEDVLDELLTVFLAGFDTTAVTLQFALYFLAKNPHVQEKAVRELQNIFDAADSTKVTPDILQRMQYVEMIVKETLRMHPPVFFYMKEVGADTSLISSDLVVPAGAMVTISPRAMHMDPKSYPDPHVFDPERFSPENSAKRHPCAFIPFGAGMRTCIGKNYAMLVLKTVLSKVIWNYHIQPDELYEPQLLWGITTISSNGMRIKLLKRSTEESSTL